MPGFAEYFAEAQTPGRGPGRLLLFGGHRRFFAAMLDLFVDHFLERLVIFVGIRFRFPFRSGALNEPVTVTCDWPPNRLVLCLKIKGVENDWRPLLAHVESLQCLKGGPPFFVQCNNLAINKCIPNIERGDRIFYFREFAAQILFVSRGRSPPAALRQ